MSHSGLNEDDLRAVITGKPSPERDEALKRLVVEAFARGWEACERATFDALVMDGHAAAERAEPIQ